MTILMPILVALCFGATARAATSTDQRPPIMVVTMDKTQTTRSTLVLTVYADEDTSVVISGSLSPTKHGAKRIAISTSTVSVVAGQTKAFRIGLGPRAARALKLKQEIKARLRFVGTDAAANPTVKSTHLILKYKNK
jgi:hypothetical protein